MRRTLSVTVALSTLAASLTLAAAAHAQVASDPFDRGRNEGVRERPRPETDPIGMPAGAFRLYPSLGASITQDDNVFAGEVVEENDTIFSLSPAASLRSQWSRHELVLAARGEQRSFSDFDNEDTTTYRASADGRVDVRRDLRGRMSLSHERGYEPRGENDPLGLVEPIELTEDRIAGSLQKEFSRVRVSVGAAHSELDFEDGRLGGGGVFDQDFRDRDLTEWDARIDYALTPSVAVFATYVDRSYDYVETPPVPGGNRNFDSNRAIAGVSFDLSNLVRGEVGAGHVTSDSATGIGDFDGFSQYAALDWFVTRLTTVSLRAERDVEEAGVFTAASILRDHYVLNIDHEILRNVLVGFEANWRSDEFDGIDRDDDIKGLSAGVEWFVNRLAVVHASIYRHDQESTGVDRTRSYDRTAATIGVTLRR